LDGEERFDDTGGEEDTDTPTHVDIGRQVSSEADGADFSGVSDGPEKSAKGSRGGTAYVQRLEDTPWLRGLADKPRGIQQSSPDRRGPEQRLRFLYDQYMLYFYLSISC
jgi:hypothetical protein